MKCLLRHILLAATLLCQMCISVSCSSDTDDVHDPGIVSGVAMFVVNTEIMGASRNADSGIVPDCELIHTLRIVILHADGTVEHNRYYSLEDARAQKSIILKVRSNEKKKIFLFANEESVSAIEGVTDSRTLTLFFDGYSDDSPGFADAVDGLYFAPDYSDGKPVPMSSMYELEPFEGRAEKTFHLVRVATKFTVNFMNWRGEDVTVDSFTIAKHADKSFLMAHVNNSEQNRILFNGKSWIEWLKKVSDASELGSQIVVQGGTFYNDAVLRSFEKIAGCEAIRPDIAGIMGAFGAALIARERYEEGYETAMLSYEKLCSLKYETSMAKCRGCTNSCRLTVNKFSGGRQEQHG